jgi:hypothetical protein
VDLILQEAIKKITEIFNFVAVRVFLFDRNMENLEIRAAYEVRPEFWPKVSLRRRRQGLIGRVTETGESIIIEDTHPDYTQYAGS